MVLLQLLLEAIEDPQVQTLSLFDLIVKGGVIMIPILLLSLLSVYIMVERFIFIRKASALDKNFMASIKNLLFQGNKNAALDLCKKTDSPTAIVIARGIQRIGSPINEIKDELHSVANIEMAKMESNLSYLGLVSGTAPMLGFIGTIIGIIKIFYNISLSDNISIGIIAGGLYEKMITSCSGLIVGVIAYTGYHYLNMMLDKFALQTEEKSNEFLDILREPLKK
jgi:biopolymer transport protein ExbB